MRIDHFKDPLRCDRNNRAGGVAIYVKDTPECERRRDFEVKELECVWAQVSRPQYSSLWYVQTAKRKSELLESCA